MKEDGPGIKESLKPFRESPAAPGPGAGPGAWRIRLRRGRLFGRGVRYRHRILQTGATGEKMKRRNQAYCRLMCLFFMLSLPSLALAAQAVDAGDASGVIRERYAPLLAEYSRIFMGDGALDCIGFALKNDMVSSDLKALLQKEERAREKNDGMGNLDFDFFFNAQDFGDKPLAITSVVRDGKTYVMKVDNGFPGEKPYDFILVEESGRWVIADVRYVQDGATVTLVNLLK
jgi:hypothetical protein